MANQPTGRSLLRQLVVDEQPGAPNEGLVALQTAELLRTTLLSRSELPPRPAAAAAAPGDHRPEIAAPQPPPPPRALAGRLRRAVQPRRRQCRVAGLGDGQPRRRPAVRRRAGCQRPVCWAGTISGPEGSATVGAWLAGAAVFVRCEPADGRLYAIAARGRRGDSPRRRTQPPMPRWSPTRRATTAGALYVRADGGFEVAWWLRFGVRGVAGVDPAGRAGTVRGQRGRRVGSSVPGGAAARRPVLVMTRVALRFEANVVDPDVELCFSGQIMMLTSWSCRAAPAERRSRTAPGR